MAETSARVQTGGGEAARGGVDGHAREPQAARRSCAAARRRATWRSTTSASTGSTTGRRTARCRATAARRGRSCSPARSKLRQLAARRRRHPTRRAHPEPGPQGPALLRAQSARLGADRPRGLRLQRLRRTSTSAISPPASTCRTSS